MKLVIATVGALVLVSGLCQANELVDLGPKANYEKADLVAIGKVTSRGIPFDLKYPGMEAISVEVEVVMKGNQAVRTMIVPIVTSAEFRCDYGVVGERYLFLLYKSEDKNKEGVYGPVDACYGVLRIQDTRVRYPKGA